MASDTLDDAREFTTFALPDVPKVGETDTVENESFEVRGVV